MSEPEPSGAVDFTYLDRVLAGDYAVMAEVLTIFQDQARGWSEQLQGEPANQRDLAHTIKGAARGIGAIALGDAADKAEFGGPGDLPALCEELARAVAAIEGYFAEFGGR